MPIDFSCKVLISDIELIHNIFNIEVETVADPGFPRGGGANCQRGGANLLFWSIFPENCMNMKEFGPRGGGVHPWHLPLDPPMGNE